MFSIPKRHALVKRDAFYYFWRYVANSSRTRRAARHTPEFSDTSGIARELAEEGIMRAESSVFLTAEGQQHLAAVSRQILEKSRSPEVVNILESGGASADAGANPKKGSYLVNLLSRDEVYSPDNALIKLALDAKLLEIIAAYLGLWPRLHAISPMPRPISIKPRRRHLSSSVRWLYCVPMAIPVIAGVALGL